MSEWNALEGREPREKQVTTAVLLYLFCSEYGNHASNPPPQGVAVVQARKGDPGCFVVRVTLGWVIDRYITLIAQ